MKRALVALVALSAATPAHALDPYMWGVGPRVGTMVLPGRYPVFFPKKAVDETSLERVRDDILFGVEGVYYINAHSRAGVTGGIGLGKGYLDTSALFGVDWVTQTGAMDFLLGGGAGFASKRFKSDAGEKLVVPSYPLRARASALLRDDTRGYQATVFGQWDIPGNQFLTAADGSDIEKPGFALYLTLGVEVAVFFGDMTPPRRKKRGED